MTNLTREVSPDVWSPAGGGRYVGTDPAGGCER
jgi:hypothetical protein